MVTRTSIAVFVSLLCIEASGALALDDVVKKRYDTSRAAASPVIDGRFDDTCWAPTRVLPSDSTYLYEGPYIDVIDCRDTYRLSKTCFHDDWHDCYHYVLFNRDVEPVLYTRHGIHTVLSRIYGLDIPHFRVHTV